ncbi:MAG: N-acetylmuramoyl-L-alanine amidase [Lachnospiraceae bacterium]|nr:N-acetylmuramoyl-L-alanine amidase [Lachnospiraceae bacterium]
MKNICRVILTAAVLVILAGCAGNAPEEAGASSQKEHGSGLSAGGPHLSDSGLRRNNIKTKSVGIDPDWEWADLAEISSGSAVLYMAATGRKDIVIGVNAGHGTLGGEYARVYCHPDKTPKVTNGSNPKGSLTAVAVSAGMIFNDGTYESDVALRCAQILRDILLDHGYDVLMLRDEEDVQLDNVARSVIANNTADCLVSLHWDGDGLDYDKGCFCIPTPDEIKEMEPVASVWQEHDRLGEALMDGLRSHKCRIYQGRNDPLELTQTCYSKIPAALVELGNGASVHDDDTLSNIAAGLFEGIEDYITRKE